MTFGEAGEGHVVTQLVQSLLTLIVIPKEKGLLDEFKSWKLSDLPGSGWPSLEPSMDVAHDTKNLFDVMRHLRNAVTHGHILFIGIGPGGADSRHLSEIAIEFWDQDDRHAPIDWRMTIDGVDLRRVCELLGHVIFS